jgi:hypothetical protein
VREKREATKNLYHYQESKRHKKQMEVGIIIKKISSDIARAKQKITR